MYLWHTCNVPTWHIQIIFLVILLFIFVQNIMKHKLYDLHYFQLITSHLWCNLYNLRAHVNNMVMARSIIHSLWLLLVVPQCHWLVGTEQLCGLRVNYGGMICMALFPNPTELQKGASPLNYRAPRGGAAFWLAFLLQKSLKSFQKRRISLICCLLGTGRLIWNVMERSEDWTLQPGIWWQHWRNNSCWSKCKGCTVRGCHFEFNYPTSNWMFKITAWKTVFKPSDYTNVFFNVFI